MKNIRDRIIQVPTSPILFDEDGECDFTGEEIEQNEPGIKISKRRENYLYLKADTAHIVAEKILEENLDDISNIEKKESNEFHCYVCGCDEKGENFSFEEINLKVCPGCMEHFLSSIKGICEGIDEIIFYWDRSGFRAVKVEEGFDFKGNKIEKDICIDIGGEQDSIGVLETNFYVRMSEIGEFVEDLRKRNFESGSWTQEKKCSLCGETVKEYTKPTNHNNHYNPILCENCIPQLANNLEKFTKEEKELYVSYSI